MDNQRSVRRQYFIRGQPMNREMCPIFQTFEAGTLLIQELDQLCADIPARFHESDSSLFRVNDYKWNYEHKEAWLRPNGTMDLQVTLKGENTTGRTKESVLSIRFDMWRDTPAEDSNW